MPAGPTGPFPKSDVAHWGDFFAAATYGVDFGCLQGKGEVGYATVGEYLSPVLDSIARSINSDDHANGKRSGKFDRHLSRWFKIGFR